VKGAVAAAAAVGLLLALPAASGRSASTLTVLAASSLTNVLPAIDSSPRYSFAGSDKLAAQLRQGVPADVYAAASPRFPEQLYADHLVEKPVRFASNRLVLIVPKANRAHIRSVFDLTHDGVKVLIGDPSVPIGTYTRQVLARLRISKAVLANVVSEEPDVRSILAKVALREADAGFVYVTDAKTAAGSVRALAIPRRGKPIARYEVAIVRGTHAHAAAATFVRELLSRRAQRVLRAAGFGPPR
jgi:molybdate transport system substrate-binding protein